METEVEGIAQKEAGEKGNRGDVGPKNGKVYKYYEPCGKKAEIISPDLFVKRIYAARVPAVFDHMLEVPCHNKYHTRSKEQSEERSDCSGFFEIGAAGDDEGTPAYAGPDRKGPHPERGEAFLKALSVFVRAHRNSPFSNSVETEQKKR